MNADSPYVRALRLACQTQGSVDALASSLGAHPRAVRQWLAGYPMPFHIYEKALQLGRDRVRPPLLPPSARTVLVADSDATFLFGLVALLRDSHYDVHYTGNGSLVLDVAKRAKPDVIMVDLGIAGISGFEVCTRIRRDSELSRTTVVAYSSHDSGELRFLASQVGFDDYHPKAALYRRLGSRSPVVGGHPDTGRFKP